MSQEQRTSATAFPVALAVCVAVMIVLNTTVGPAALLPSMLATVLVLSLVRLPAGAASVNYASLLLNKPVGLSSGARESIDLASATPAQQGAAKTFIVGSVLLCLAAVLV